MPIYDWDTFKRYHGGIVGARDCFEKLVEEMYRKKYPDKNVQIVKAARGDGGIDVLIGEIGVEDIEVYQCKYFDDKIDSSKWQQITNSFETAKNSKQYNMCKWTLCIPKELTLAENREWSIWKQEHKQDNLIIELCNGNEIINNLEELKIIYKYFKSEVPKYISNAVNSVSDYCICRMNDVETIVELLNEKDNILITGMGGYGKTSLARMLFHRIKTEYEHIGWVNYAGEFKSSLLNSLTIFKDVDEEERINLIYDFFQQQEYKTILFIDNVEENFINNEYVKKLDGCVKLIVTSRISDIENFTTVPIRTLSKKECVEIFKLYAEINNDEEIGKIVDYMNNNILLIELFAKTVKYSEVSFEELVEQLTTFGYTSVEDIIYTSYDNKEETIYNRVMQLYSIQKLLSPQKKILKNFALTPNIQLPFLYRDWINADKNQVVKLIKLGWLQKNEIGYTMHPVIKESLLMQEKISLNDCDNILELMNKKEFWNLSEGYEVNLNKEMIANKVINYFLPENYIIMENIIIEYYNFCLLLSKYDNAINLLHYVKKIYMDNEPLNNNKLLNINLSLAYSYFHAMKYKMSKKFLCLVDELVDECNICDDAVLFEIYNLHIILSSLENKADEAIIYFNKICKLELLEGEFLLAIINFSSGLMDCGEYSKALQYMLKYKEKIEKYLFDNKAYLATYYSNLAIAYSHTEYEGYYVSLEYDLKALKIRKKIFGKKSKDLAITYLALADDYLMLNDVEKSKQCILEAEDICRNLFTDSNNQLFKSVISAKNTIYKKFDKV